MEFAFSRVAYEGVGPAGIQSEAFTQPARDYGLLIPKCMLVLGVPETGNATASVFDIPLLKLDAGKLFGVLVGQSEANLRSVIQTAEAISPCVLWIDEIEKAFGGMSGSDSSIDGGTSGRVFGTMLNWLQDKTKPVFVVATAIDVSKLPPELVRKGRWDELWFVDLPNSRERSDIWDIDTDEKTLPTTPKSSLAPSPSSPPEKPMPREGGFFQLSVLRFSA